MGDWGECQERVVCFCFVGLLEGFFVLFCFFEMVRLWQNNCKTENWRFEIQDKLTGKLAAWLVTTRERNGDVKRKVSATPQNSEGQRAKGR